MKKYIKPLIINSDYKGGIPTILAVGAAAALAGAASVGVSKLIGDERFICKNKHIDKSEG